MLEYAAMDVKLGNYEAQLCQSLVVEKKRTANKPVQQAYKKKEVITVLVSQYYFLPGKRYHNALLY